MVDFNPSMLLLGEQTIEIFKVVKPDHTYTYERRILDVADKVRGAMITKETRCFDEKGELVTISV